MGDRLGIPSVVDFIFSFLFCVDYIWKAPSAGYAVMYRVGGKCLCTIRDSANCRYLALEENESLQLSVFPSGHPSKY